ncbi:TolC family outer membrane protein [Methyloglobulus sp.]|uniref:TolC family outer membrane protein n=1 Tax=Methyloglobulus sp. TaxID=2518622 RepID=UPI0039897AB4
MNWFKVGLTILILVVGNTCYADDLLSIYQQALEADPELKSSETKIKIGDAQKGQALGEMLPQITGTANWSTNSQRQGNRGNDYAGTSYVISLNQTLLDFPKFWNWRKSQAVESQYTLENVQAQQTLLFKVVDKYFTVLEAEDELSFYYSEEETTAQQLAQIQALYDKQLVKITDMYAIEARLDQIKADIIEAEAKVVTAKEGLRELTNTTPAMLLKLREGIDYKELEGKLEDWLAVAKSENPTLAAQQYAIAAADLDVTAQKARHLPVVELQLNYYNTNTGFQSAFVNQTDTQVAAINVNVPIFSGGTITQRTQEAQHKLTLNKYDNEAKLRALVKETSDAFLTSNANVRRIKATRKALESATKSREAVEAGFGYGVETISDVLKAQEEEFKTKRDLAKAKYGYIKNRMRFMQAIGMISEENLAEAKGWLQTTPAQEMQCFK